jgi:hypothetical protein
MPLRTLSLQSIPVIVANRKDIPLKMNKHIVRIVLAMSLLFALLITYFVYQPGLTGSFIFDDAPNIVNNNTLAIKDFHLDTLMHAAFSIPSGPFRRPISMLSFAANIYETGFNPFDFKLTNLLIHLMNGLGIFTLSIQLIGIYRKRFQPDLSAWHIQTISVAVATAWLLHPFGLTSVLYIVQRMTSLSALFSIWGLALFTWGRTRLFEGKGGIPAILASLLIFMPLAALSKETGSLMPAFMLVIELSLFRFQVNKPASHRFLVGFYAITVIVPAVATLVFLTTHMGWLIDSYQGRSFTLPERVMTEARILWFYLGQIIFPNVSKMGIYHDDIIMSHGLLNPITTLPAIIGIVALIAAAWLARKNAPLITFGILFFFCGHVLESTIFPLELVHEHRNYLPMYGIVLAMFFYLLYPLKYAANLRIRQIAALLLIALFAYGTWSRAHMWAVPFDLAKSEVEHHPNSARANGEMGSNYTTVTTQDAEINEVYYQRAVHFFERSADVDPDYTSGLVNLIMFASSKGKPVDPRWIAELTHRLEFSPAENGSGNKLIALFNCQFEKQCQLTNHDMEEFIHASLRNPTITGTNRASVLSSYSYYLINVNSDYPAALKVMYETVENAPKEPSYRMALIQFLSALGHYDEAKRQLAIFKGMNNLGTYNEKIASQEKLLTAHSTQP